MVLLRKVSMPWWVPTKKVKVRLKTGKSIKNSGVYLVMLDNKNRDRLPLDPDRTPFVLGWARFGPLCLRYCEHSKLHKSGTLKHPQQILKNPRMRMPTWSVILEGLQKKLSSWEILGFLKLVDLGQLLENA